MPIRPAAWSAGPAARRVRRRARTAEALVLLGVATAAQRWIPMRHWSWVLGVASPVPAPWLDRTVIQLPQRAASGLERQVAGSLHRAAGALPWGPSCLAQAAAGQVMLRRRGRPAVVVIGLRAGPDGAESGRRWDAHAWLLGSQGALTGGPAATGFTATTVFQVPGALTADAVDLSAPVVFAPRVAARAVTAPAAVPPPRVGDRPYLMVPLSAQHLEGLRMMRNQEQVRHGFCDSAIIPQSAQQAWFARYAADPSDCMWVGLDDGGEVLAAVGLSGVTAHGAQVGRVMRSHDPVRGQPGLGRAVVAWVVQVADAVGLPELSLEVLRDNEAAIAAYRSAGFDFRDQAGSGRTRLMRRTRPD